MTSCSILTNVATYVVVYFAGNGFFDSIPGEIDECRFSKNKSFNEKFIEGSLCIYPDSILSAGDTIYAGGRYGILKLDLKDGKQSLFSRYTAYDMEVKDEKIYGIGKDTSKALYLYGIPAIYSFSGEKIIEENALSKFSDYWFSFDEIQYFENEWYFSDGYDLYVIRDDEKKNLTGEIRGSDCDEGDFERAELGTINGFFVAGNEIYVTDRTCGYLRKIDLVNREIVNLDGKFEQTRHVANVGNKIYYTTDESLIRYFDMETQEKDIYAGYRNTHEEEPKQYVGGHDYTYEVYFAKITCLASFKNFLYLCNVFDTSVGDGYSTVVRIDTETSKVETLLFPKGVSEKTK